MKIHLGGNRINVKARKVSSFGKVRGLIFRSKNTDNLLFEFKKDGKRGIHSLFLFFPFLAVWLDSKDRVLEFRVVDPFCFHVCPDVLSRKILEIPLNKENEKVLRLFVDGKGKI